MKLTNWRWWQWGALSLIAGAAVAFAFTQVDPDSSVAQSVPFNQLRNRIERRTDTGESIVTRIRVSPVTLDGNGKKMQVVSYWEKQRNRVTGKWDPTQQFITRVSNPMGPVGNKSITDFLEEVKKQVPTLDYKFQWWLEPKTIWLSCLAGSFLLIGVLWPIALQAMIKMGLAEPPDERMDLSAVRTVDEPSAEPIGPLVTAADHQKLSDLTTAMEKNVAGMGLGSGGGGAEGRPHSDAPVKDLGVGERPMPVAMPAVKEDPSDFKGEFYPVARPIKKDD